jgi:hypothetical protein
MNLRQWGLDGYAQDTWRITPNTVIDVGLRYEFTSALSDISRPSSNLILDATGLHAFIEGQNGYPHGLMYPNTHDFAPRFGIAHHIVPAGLVFRAAYGIFYTPVDMNTWCNERHNVPYVFPETNQSNNFVPQINGFNFGPAVLGKTVVSFAAFDPHAPAQYVEQWSASIEKSVGKSTTVEIGYLGLPPAALAPDQQRAPRSGTDPAAPAVPDRLVRRRHGVAAGHHGCQYDIPGERDQLARRHRAELVRRGVRERAAAVFLGSHAPGQLHLLEEPDGRPRFPFADVRIRRPAE